jgi:hypothetical protein
MTVCSGLESEVKGRLRDFRFQPIADHLGRCSPHLRSRRNDPAESGDDRAAMYQQLAKYTEVPVETMKIGLVHLDAGRRASLS